MAGVKKECPSCRALAYDDDQLVHLAGCAVAVEMARALLRSPPPSVVERMEQELADLRERNRLLQEACAVFEKNSAGAAQMWSALRRIAALDDRPAADPGDTLQRFREAVREAKDAQRLEYLSRRPARAPRRRFHATVEAGGDDRAALARLLREFADDVEAGGAGPIISGGVSSGGWLELAEDAGMTPETYQAALAARRNEEGLR